MSLQMSFDDFLDVCACELVKPPMPHMFCFENVRTAELRITVVYIVRISESSQIREFHDLSD